MAASLAYIWTIGWSLRNLPVNLFPFPSSPALSPVEGLSTSIPPPLASTRFLEITNIIPHNATRGKGQEPKLLPLSAYFRHSRFYSTVTLLARLRG